MTVLVEPQLQPRIPSTGEDSAPISVFPTEDIVGRLSATMVDIHAPDRLAACRLQMPGSNEMTPEIRRSGNKAINFGSILRDSLDTVTPGTSLFRGPRPQGPFIRYLFSSRFPAILDLHGGHQKFRERNTARVARCSDAGNPTLPRSAPAARVRASPSGPPQINARFQGTAADIIRRAMVRMGRAFGRACLRKNAPFRCTTQAACPRVEAASRRGAGGPCTACDGKPRHCLRWRSTCRLEVDAGQRRDLGVAH